MSRPKARAGEATEARTIGERVVKDFATEIRALDGEERSVQFTITTGAADRDRDVISPGGWKLDSFLKNPVVLFAHQYDALPVARARSITQTGDGLTSIADFPPRGVYPFADQVHDMVKAGFLNATSVGFKPMKWAMNEERGGIDFMEQELLEYSIVPVPANQEALALRTKGIGDEHIEKWALALREWLERYALALKVVPANVSAAKAPQGEAWSAPSLGDFTDKGWGDLSDAEKRHIAGHFAWANEMPPASYGDLKLPHHRASDGAVVFRGVVAAAGRLNQTQGVNEAAVKAHLASHYHAFGETPPWEGAGAESEVEKRGRVLAARNEQRLRQAHAGIGEVLSELESQQEEEAAVDVVTVTTADEPVLMIEDSDGEPRFRLEEDDRFEFDPKDFTEALREAVAAPLRDVISEQVAAAMTRYTGRVD